MRVPKLRRRPNPVRGAAAGFIGGLAGAWTMNQFQSLVSKVKRNCEGTSGQLAAPRDNDDATMKAAERTLHSVAGVTLTEEQKKKAGPIVHYAFGAVMGALYGTLIESKRHANAGEGALLGAALFVGADELAVPALGLSQSPAKYPLSVHATALGAHLVYGLTTETVRRKLRSGLKLG